MREMNPHFTKKKTHPQKTNEDSLLFTSFISMYFLYVHMYTVCITRNEISNQNAFQR